MLGCSNLPKLSKVTYGVWYRQPHKTRDAKVKRPNCERFENSPAHVFESFKPQLPARMPSNLLVLRLADTTRRFGDDTCAFSQSRSRKVLGHRAEWERGKSAGIVQSWR